ncbi:MAG: P-loop NTPase [Nitrososphaerota archaeon]|nr:P-loop NTPase [Candidatus Calditenuaceae archaeon]MDW8073614.1 P-loop NTPase [Nitrososphaerota archaeon]
MSRARNSSKGPLDYRELLIEARLRDVSRTVLVTGGKGGVGKSLIAATAALLLSRSNNRTGLLDLDLHGPSSCLILGVEDSPVEAEDGLIPPIVGGVKVMSVDLLSRGRPLPLTGRAKEEVVKEVLALTFYGRLDYLLVDLPPGTGDELLTVSRYVRRRGEAIVVTTPTTLSLQVAKRVIQILESMTLKIVGVLENMHAGGGSPSKELAREAGIEFLGAIPYDPSLDGRVGRLRPDELLSTRFAESLREILRQASYHL